MEKHLLKIMGLLSYILLLASCSSTALPTLVPNNETTPVIAAAPTDTALWEGNTQIIWSKLIRTSSTQLTHMKTDDPLKSAWIQLALISKQDSTNTPRLLHELQNWRATYPSHPANSLFPENSVLEQILSTIPPQRIALLLPESGTYADSGQIVREGFLNAYYKNRATVGKQDVKFYNTAQTTHMMTIYQQAVSNGSDFIIGPLVKNDVEQLSNQNSFLIDTLALNYTNGRLPSHFYEFGLLPEDETAQIANKALQAGLRSALIIAPKNAWGNRIVSSFLTRWQASGGSVTDSLFYTPKTDFNVEIARLLHISSNSNQKLSREKNNKSLLEQQGRHDFDVIFLFAEPEEAHNIVPLIRYYHPNNVAIYASSSVYSGRPNPAKDVDLNGVMICDIPWRKNTMQSDNNRLYAVGQDAYLLSQTLPRLIQLPNFPIYGKTGALTLSQQQIHRSLPCTTIQNGLL